MGFLKTCFRFLIRLIAFLLLLSCLFYLRTTIYNFEEPKPFSGNFLYNPYENINSGDWYKANFHAHSYAWGGSTNGKQQPEEIVNAYLNKGYSAPCISNYHQITEKTGDYIHIPTYEHGYNLLKSHKLSIGSENVSFFDFPLFQALSHKQKIILILRENGAHVAIAHPKFRNGHPESDFERLSGYHFIEVLNHYRISDQHWDRALSSGKLAWLLADDDTHDITGKGNTFVMWTMINSAKGDAESLLGALAFGNAYGVKGADAFNDNLLKECVVEGMEVKWKFREPAKEIRLIGQNGIVKKVITNSDSINYRFTEDDTYIRAHIINEKSEMYLNPIARFDGKTLPLTANKFPQVNLWKTLLFRGGVTIFGLLLVYFLFGKRLHQLRRKR